MSCSLVVIATAAAAAVLGGKPPAVTLSFYKTIPLAAILVVLGNPNADY